MKDKRFLISLFVLLAICIFIFKNPSRKKYDIHLSEALSSPFPSFSSSRVTELFLRGLKGETSEVTIRKQDDHWWILHPEGRIPVLARRIEELLREGEKLSKVAVVSKKVSFWKKYQLADTDLPSLIFCGGSGILLNIKVGKAGLGGGSFVRNGALPNEGRVVQADYDYKGLMEQPLGRWIDPRPFDFSESSLDAFTIHIENKLLHFKRGKKGWESLDLTAKVSNSEAIRNYIQKLVGITGYYILPFGDTRPLYLNDKAEFGNYILRKHSGETIAVRMGYVGDGAAYLYRSGRPAAYKISEATVRSFMKTDRLFHSSSSSPKTKPSHSLP